MTVAFGVAAIRLANRESTSRKELRQHPTQGFQVVWLAQDRRFGEARVQVGVAAVSRGERERNLALDQCRRDWPTLAVVELHIEDRGVDGIATRNSRQRVACGREAARKRATQFVEHILEKHGDQRFVFHDKNALARHHATSHVKRDGLSDRGRQTMRNDGRSEAKMAEDQVRTEINRKSEPALAFVVAVARNGIIGRDGQLPWRLSSDLKTFRRLTMGKPLIMGRKTWDSLGRPLDGRDNIVVTRDPGFAAEGALVVHDVAAAVAMAQGCATRRGVDEIMVIGGAHIFAALLDQAQRIYWTAVEADPPGDVTFPEIDLRQWHEVSSQVLPRGNRDEYPATLRILERATVNAAPGGAAGTTASIG